MNREARESSSHSHWSKDYVEHLRTIHFTLIVVCVALIVMISTNHKSAISNARDELRGIRSVVDNWDPHWLEEEAKNALANSAPGTQLSVTKKDEIEVQTPGGMKVVLKLRHDGPNWIVNAPDDSLYTLLPSRFPIIFQMEPPDLATFHKFWDAIKHGLDLDVPVNLDDIPLVFDMSHALKAQFVSGETPTMHTPLILTLNVRTAHSDLPSEYPKGFYASEPSLVSPFEPSLPTHFFRVVVPVSQRESIYFDPHPLFTPPGAEWRRESFDDTFPDLTDVTKNYENLDFDNLDKILEAEESCAGDSFEIVGIKFPAEDVTG